MNKQQAINTSTGTAPRSIVHSLKCSAHQHSYALNEVENTGQWSLVAVTWFHELRS